MTIPPILNTLPSISAIAWTPIIFATVVVALRLYVRIRRHAFGTDDFLMLLSLLFALVSSSLAQTLYQIIKSPHSDPSLPARGHRNTISLLASTTGILSLTFSKSSVAYLLLLLVGPARPRQRYFLLATVVLLALSAFLMLVGTIIPDCDQVLLSVETGAACIDDNVAEGFIQAWNFYAVFLDLAYSTLPIAILGAVRMSPRKKAGVLVLLGLGWMAGIFTLLRAITAFVNWEDETTAFIVRLAVAMEQALVIICGSLATLTPLYRWAVTGVPIRPYNAASLASPPGTNIYAARMSRREGSKIGFGPTAVMTATHAPYDV